jgi:hypothetical protein
MRLNQNGLKLRKKENNTHFHFLDPYGRDSVLDLIQELR